MITNKLKPLYWKSVQNTRDGWERKFTLYVKQVLNKQFRDIEVDTTNYFDTERIKADPVPIERMFVEIYKVVGVDFARQQYHRLKAKKAEDPEDEWIHEMTTYAKMKAGKRIVSIAESTRVQAVKIIREVLEQSALEGWGADETARTIRKTLVSKGIEINQWRALRIARTEVMTASNVGAMKGAESTDLPMEKFWISTYDSRTRDTHAVVEEQNPKDMNEDFKVGDYEMAYPGDARGGPEEVINCRCTVAFNVKGFNI